MGNIHMKYTTTIGLEVHAELKTKSKMFCGCENNPHDSEANAHTCPVCVAHPGTLPVPNEEAIKKVLLFGKAVEATSAKYSEFDRKNYFYPDIPKAYQISQYAFPFLTGGALKGVELTRVHLEEDTARSVHDKGLGSLVDFNRAGVPLMELVTEPVIHDAKTASDFAKELQLLLRTLDISDANMEKGEMRVEANISVSDNPDKLGTKVEVKNINSFKSVEGAIEFEVKRQIELIEKGGAVSQETRGWDEVKLRTFSQRSKETAKDYRYFPDPDLSKMSVPQHAPFSNARLSEIMPTLPNIKRNLYQNLGLPSDAIEIIIADKELDAVMDSVANSDMANQKGFAKLAANYLVSDVSPLRGAGDVDMKQFNTAYFAELIGMLLENKLNSRVAKDLLPDLFMEGLSPLQIATERGLLQVSDESSLQTIVDEVIANNETIAAEYRAGKESVLNFFLGQGMKASRGSANPEVLLKMFKISLKK